MAIKNLKHHLCWYQIQMLDIPKRIKQKALKYIDKHAKTFNPDVPLIGAFNWEATSLKHVFWQELHYKFGVDFLNRDYLDDKHVIKVIRKFAVKYDKEHAK